VYTMIRFDGKKVENIAYIIKSVILLNAAILFCVNGCSKPTIAEQQKLTIPEKWQSSMSVGDLIIDCNAFYSVPWELGLFPAVRIHLPVENLTSKTLQFNVNYRTESKITGYRNSGMGVCYTLAPNEKRLIDTIAPIASVVRPIRFKFRMSEPFFDKDEESSTQTVLEIDPFKTNKAQPVNLELKKVKNTYFDVQNAQLSYSSEQGNVVIFQVQNLSNKDVGFACYVAVDDPEESDIKGSVFAGGFFSKSIETIPAGSNKKITIPYDIPPVGPKPVLVYTVFKPNIMESFSREHDKKRWDITLAGYGSFDLIEAQEQDLCLIPEFLPVEERAKLTLQKETKHFLFRYRPDSYAEQNIEKAISDREAAYQKLSEVLKMELPEIVTIDLYPDMEAKGLGSGTTWTPANTRNNKHICEVYNEGYKCDSYHELAHIFSYHFPGFSSNKGGIVESFAAYFEPENMKIEPTKRLLREQLKEGKLPSLVEVLQSESSSQELVILIDFLLNKDVEKFKEFYVNVTKSQEKASIEKALRQIYEIEPKELEQQWHEYINQENTI